MTYTTNNGYYLLGKEGYRSLSFLARAKKESMKRSEEAKSLAASIQELIALGFEGDELNDCITCLVSISLARAMNQIDSESEHDGVVVG